MKHQYLVVVTESSGNVQQHQFVESYEDIKSSFDRSKEINNYVGYQVYQKMLTNECDTKINAHETYVLKLSWGKKAVIKDHNCS